MIRNDLKHIQLEVKSRITTFQFFGQPTNRRRNRTQKNLYRKDVENQASRFRSGFCTQLRGPYTTMYVRRPWTIRQYAGFQPLKKMLLQT
jgi:methylmalonyl-CoA mutase